MAGQTKIGVPLGATPVAREIIDTINDLIDDLELLRDQYGAHQHAALSAAPSTNTIAAASLKAGKIR